MRSLSGRKVVVIGGSYGMGLATAELAVDAGAEVAIAARGEERLQDILHKHDKQQRYVRVRQKIVSAI